MRQVEEFKPKIACFEELIDIPDELKKHTEFFLGKGSYRYAITECDVLFVALSGFVGFSAVLSGIKKVKKISKEKK